MMIDEVLSYGVQETRVAIEDIDAHIEEIEVLGYTVVDSGMTPAEIDSVRSRIDENYERQLAETSRAVIRSDADILRCPLVYDGIFLKAATGPSLMAICQRLLGENFVLLQQNGIINRSTSKEFQSRWHRDLPYQHFVISRKLALNALLCVDDFTVETGGTVILPGSHMFESFPSSGFVRKHEVAVSAKAGSVLVLDAMLYHRSGFNISGHNRRGVNHVIGRPLLVQQIDIPRLLEGRYSEDAFLRRYLGYQWNPASSVLEWRRVRAEA
jgi:ectoine hydroxylase-related dioxygenase (phytanoyl-CoA dioxygenase family)